MHSPREILLPIDFSPSSVDVTRSAAAVARYFHSRITLLHVLPSIEPAWAALGGGGAPLEEVLAHQKEEVCNSLQQFLADELRDLVVKRIVYEGNAGEIIAAYCASERVGLVMMPTRGSSAFRRFLLGSVTAKVLSDVTCPVWTNSYRSGNRLAVSAIPKAIVCAINRIPEAGEMAHWAADAASDLHARLLVAHAIPSLKFSPEAHHPQREMQPSLVEAERATIQHALDRLQVRGAELRVEGGNVSMVVRSVVEDSRADLLVIGRASDRGVLGRMRTHSYTLIRESPCPVISI